MDSSFYDAESISDGRYLILSDTKQQFPTERLKVTGQEKRKSKMSGSEFPVLILEDESGNQYQVSAWLRDVRACVKEWGGTPTDWGYVTFAKADGGRRYEVVPHSDQMPKEEHI